MWLRRRLGTAERGRDQLDRKLRILIPEQERLRARAEQCGTEWAAACDDLRTWLLRAALLGGQDVVRKADAPHPVDVEVVWTTAMGLRYPADARLASTAAHPDFPAGNAAVIPASEASRTALLAGVRTAAAQEAVRRIDVEILATRRRLRALDKRWLPWLHDALTTLELALEQSEQEDGIRLRRAVAAPTDRRPTADARAGPR